MPTCISGRPIRGRQCRGQQSWCLPNKPVGHRHIHPPFQTAPHDEQAGDRLQAVGSEIFQDKLAPAIKWLRIWRSRLSLQPLKIQLLPARVFALLDIHQVTAMRADPDAGLASSVAPAGCGKIMPRVWAASRLRATVGPETTKGLPSIKVSAAPVINCFRSTRSALSWTSRS